MAKHNVSYKIFGGYAEHITDAVLDKFGGSYANRQEFRNTWRVKFPYNVECVEFIMQETRTFLRTLPDNKLHDLNFSYCLCQNIADYLSKYMARGIEYNGNSKNENKKSMQQNVLKQVFFDFPVFVNNFGERYKKTVDMSNSGWVNANPGVVAMAQYLGKISSPDESCIGCGNAVASSGAIKKHRPRIGHVDVAAYIATQRQK